MTKLLTIVSLILSLSFPFSTVALETETHKELNEYIAKGAFNGFSFDSFLRDYLGLSGGIKEDFTSNTTMKAWEWVRYGGEYEDKPPLTFKPNTWVPYLRSANHFHNPIKPIAKSINEAGFSGIWGSGFIREPIGSGPAV